jgi:DNA-binding transcriptional regulator/RsmH inhibitor MraZ
LYDVDNSYSFTLAKFLIKENKITKNLFLIGNNCEINLHRQVSYDEAKIFADENNLNFFEISTESNYNIENLLLKVVQCFKDNHEFLNVNEEYKK